MELSTLLELLPLEPLEILKEEVAVNASWDLPDPPDLPAEMVDQGTLLLLIDVNH